MIMLCFFLVLFVLSFFVFRSNYRSKEEGSLNKGISSAFALYGILISFFGFMYELVSFGFMYELVSFGF